MNRGKAISREFKKTVMELVKSWDEAPLSLPFGEFNKKVDAERELKRRIVRLIELEIEDLETHQKSPEWDGSPLV